MVVGANYLKQDYPDQGLYRNIHLVTSIGLAKLIEDCDSLDRYGDQIPTEIYSIVGSSVYVSFGVIIETHKKLRVLLISIQHTKREMRSKADKSIE